MALDVNTVIWAANDLMIRVEADQLVAQVKETPVNLVDYSLVVLEAFRRPRTFADGVKHLQKNIRQQIEWMKMTREIYRLLEAGVLVSDTQSAVKSESHQLPALAEIKLHLNLLRDVVRTQTYLSALREVVHPGDVVVDVGTGNGVLAMGAALSGAQHVYAIEQGTIANTTRKVFAANEFSDRITLLEGWSMTADLPEKADVLVSEILSNDVFTENILQVTQDASRRLLKPGGRVIPTSVRMSGRLVQVTESLRNSWTLNTDDINDWKRDYGLDYTPLYESQWHGQMRVYAQTRHAVESILLSEPVTIADLRLDYIEGLDYSYTTTVRCNRSGRLDGLIGHFDLEVAPGHTMTTDPYAKVRANSWLNPVWFCEPIEVNVDDVFRLTLTHLHSQRTSVDVTIERIESSV